MKNIEKKKLRVKDIFNAKSIYSQFSSFLGTELIVHTKYIYDERKLTYSFQDTF